MSLRIFYIACLLFAIVPVKSVIAQDSSSLYSKAYNLPDKFFGSISSRSQKLQQNLTKQTEKYLRKLQKQEMKLQKKLAKKDSSAAAEMFGNVNERYAALRQQLNDSAVTNFSNVYSGHVDSMKTALSFLQQNNLPAGSQQQLQASMQQFNQLQDKLNATDQIKKQLQLRQQQLKAQLEKFGLTKQFRKFQKDVYYYRAQVDEYKQALEDPSKLEAKLLQVANKFPAFRKFFANNSELGRLFRLPDADPGNSIASVAGLQTRAMLQQDLQNRFGSGANVNQALQRGVQAARSDMDLLKNKLDQLGNGRGDADIPNFKPNNQKTKNFWQRMEFGSNVQTTRSSNFFPVTSDIGLSAGYKLNDKSIIGIGASYKMGWGQNIRNIKISHQGIGFRSFLEWKLKGSFYATGGFEYNYQKPFNALQQLNNLDDWQQSGLAGISKIVSVKSKIFKKTKLQLLWDFLSYQQRPVTQPLKFRVGYTF
jgi:hypothetical protein